MEAADGARLTGLEVRLQGEGEKPVLRADGTFELNLPTTMRARNIEVKAVGYEIMVLEASRCADFGIVRLQPGKDRVFKVVDALGNPIEGATATCSCGTSAFTGPGGVLHIRVPLHIFGYNLDVSKGKARACSNFNGHVQIDGPELHDEPIVLREPTRVVGRVFRADGAPATGEQVVAYHQVCDQTWSTKVDEDGRYAMEVVPGAATTVLIATGQQPARWRESYRGPTYFVSFEGAEYRLDMGPVPGTHSVAVRIKPVESNDVWLLRGSHADPNSLAAVLDQPPFSVTWSSPQAEVVRFDGLLAGRYTLVAGDTLLSAGKTKRRPVIRVVDLPLANGELLDLKQASPFRRSGARRGP